MPNRRKGTPYTICKRPEVRQVIEVTGRYDFLVFLKAKSIEELHTLITDKVGAIDGVTYTETFISLRYKTKTFELLV